jgi:hypothetical protein
MLFVSQFLALLLRRAVRGSGGLLIALIMVVVMLLGAPLASADTTSWMTGPVPMAGGWSWIAADTSGNVYTYDTYTGLVKKYTGTGALLGTVGSRTDSVLGLAASPDGGVYVASTNAPNPGYTITKYNGTGNAVQTITVGTGNSSGAVVQFSGFGDDSAGNLYILDAGSSRVEKFLANGSYSTQWGSPGDGNGQFDFFNSSGAIGVAGDGTVYVGDANNRIQKFTSTGDFQTAWGSTGLGLGQFIMLGSLAVDSAGHVYAGDLSPRWTGSGTANGPLIQEFDSSGNYLGSATQGVAALTTYGDDLVYGIYGDTVYRLELTIPTVSFGLSPLGLGGVPSSVYVDQPLTATATASVPFGSVTSYVFDFGTGAPAVTGASSTATTRYQTAGTYLVTVTATSSRGGTATARATVTVNPRSPYNTASPSIAGLAVEGLRLTVTHGTWSYGPISGYSYRWYRCDRGGGRCNVIARATSPSYVLAAADVGHTIRVAETATNSAGLWGVAMSRQTAVVKVLPKLIALSVSPSGFRAARSGSSITTSPQLGTRVTFKLSMTATVRFTIKRHQSRFVPVRGSFTMTGHAGNNSFRFSGRLNGSTLPAGNYRLLATPTARGATGVAQTIAFTILR